MLYAFGILIDKERIPYSILCKINIKKEEFDINSTSIHVIFQARSKCNCNLVGRPWS